MYLRGDRANPTLEARLVALLTEAAVPVARAALRAPADACVLFGPRDRVLPLDPDAQVLDANALAILPRASLAARLERGRRDRDAANVRCEGRSPPAAFAQNAVLLAVELGGMIAVQWWDPGALLPYADRLDESSRAAEAVVPHDLWASEGEPLVWTHEGLRGGFSTRPPEVVRVRWVRESEARRAFEDLSVLQNAFSGRRVDEVRAQVRAFLDAARAFEPDDLLVERAGKLERWVRS